MKWSTEVYTSKVEESVAFYCRFFDFDVKQEMEGFAVLQHRKQAEYELIFCVPDSPFVDPLFHPEFQGKGILFQMEVDDVDAHYQSLKQQGIEIRLPMKEEAVNGKHFTVVDPNNIPIDVVQFT